MNLKEYASILRGFLNTASEYYWLVDDRVLWEDLKPAFERDFFCCDADLLATVLRTHSDESTWFWWPSLKSPLGDNRKNQGVAALLCLARFSRRAAEEILRGIEEGWEGHPEAVVPTLVSLAGLKIEDIGGDGTFAPDDRKGRWYDSRTWHWRGPVEYHRGKLHFPLASRYHAKPPELLAPEPCIAFMFLTKGDLHLPEIWREYLGQAADRSRVVAHTKHNELLDSHSLLRHAQIPRKIDTAWGDLSLVHATIALLAAALGDKSITHFILLSESCVPVRRFEDLRANLRRDDRSRLSICKRDELVFQGNTHKANRLQNLKGIQLQHAYLQEQWMCLSREDAETITSRDWTPCFEKVVVPDECFFATVLSASGKPLAEAIINRPITWTFWDAGASHPREFKTVAPRIAATISESGCFFARKFTPGSNISKWGLHRGHQTD